MISCIAVEINKKHKSLPMKKVEKIIKIYHKKGRENNKNLP